MFARCGRATRLHTRARLDCGRKGVAGWLIETKAVAGRRRVRAQRRIGKQVVVTKTSVDWLAISAHRWEEACRRGRQSAHKRKRRTAGGGAGAESARAVRQIKQCVAAGVTVL